MKPSSNQVNSHHPSVPEIFVGGMFDLVEECYKLCMVAIQPNRVEDSSSVNGNILTVFDVTMEDRGWPGEEGEHYGY
jgi:hypothetical protein